MKDTQWPAFYVFTQPAPDKPHENAGTVHAPDAELALLNARDVFVRRPECVDLWVVPASAVYAWTAAAPEGPPAPEGAGEVERYLVFVKPRQRGTHTHVGEVEAASPAEALRRARQTFAGEDIGAWWVVPAREVVASDPQEAESWFAPARDKAYRDQAFYHTETMMREIKAGRWKEGEA